MKITDVRIRTVEDKVLSPFTNSLGAALRRIWRTYIVEVFTDEGITGVFASDGLDETCKELIISQLKPVIVGENPMNYEGMWRKMFGGVGTTCHFGAVAASHREGIWRMLIAKGEVIRAMSALDTVIWDIIGKKLNTPLCRLLGGYRDKIPCYASGGHYVSLTSHAQELKHLESQMSQYMDMGFKAVKMRAGRDIAKDSERVKVVRDVIGPDVDLMIDFNTSQTYKDGVPHAIKFMRVLEKYNPYWFEDPLIMDDFRGLKQISDAVDTAIAAGEEGQTIWGFRELIINRAADIVLADAPHRCGGITQWKKIAALADTFHIPIAGHLGEEIHVHCVASVPNGLTVEVFTPLEKRRRMYAIDLLMPDKDGLLRVPQKPGLGIELNEEYINKHLVDSTALTRRDPPQSHRL